MGNLSVEWACGPGIHQAIQQRDCPDGKRFTVELICEQSRLLRKMAGELRLVVCDCTGCTRGKSESNLCTVTVSVRVTKYIVGELNPVRVTNMVTGVKQVADQS